VTLCLLTVHGIGFQQPLTGERAGYADALHENLKVELKELLADDPENLDHPLYVFSQAADPDRNNLERLSEAAPLGPAGTVVHVALVYSPLEELAPRPGSVADVLVRAGLAHSHYVSAVGALRLVLSDAWAALQEHSRIEPGSSLRPRSDQSIVAHHHGLRDMLQKRPAAGAGDPGAFGILRALEDDMATYVARNDLRERVRGFVQEALVRVLAREDIDAVVLNMHSQGTMIGWDVLARLPFARLRDDRGGQSDKLRAFVTAGSPIRKYVDMFAWGGRVGQMADLLVRPDFAWHNYWDKHDPVADPLDPGTDWKPGEEPPSECPSDKDSLLVRIDPNDGSAHHVHVEDHPVDNIANSSGGGLQAHDYWNNSTQFVAPLSSLLKEAVKA
jgi:hypothetical protein